MLEKRSRWIAFFSVIAAIIVVAPVSYYEISSHNTGLPVVSVTEQNATYNWTYDFSNLSGVLLFKNIRIVPNGQGLFTYNNTTVGKYLRANNSLFDNISTSAVILGKGTNDSHLNLAISAKFVNGNPENPTYCLQLDMILTGYIAPTLMPTSMDIIQGNQINLTNSDYHPLSIWGVLLNSTNLSDGLNFTNTWYCQNKDGYSQNTNNVEYTKNNNTYETTLSMNFTNAINESSPTLYRFNASMWYCMFLPRLLSDNGQCFPQNSFWITVQLNGYSEPVDLTDYVNMNEVV